MSMIVVAVFGLMAVVLMAGCSGPSGASSDTATGVAERSSTAGRWHC